MVHSTVGKIPEGRQPYVLRDLAIQERRTVQPGEVDPDTPYFGLEHLRRLTDTVLVPIKSAVNSAIRQGILDYEGSIIWREK